MVKQFSSFLEEDFSNWQKKQAEQQKQQEELRQQQETEARRTAEWVSSRPFIMKAMDVVLPGQQFRTPPPPPEPKGFGDFRLVESALSAGGQRRLPGTSIGPLRPGSYIEVPQDYGQPPKQLLPGYLGEFESRVRDVAARTAAPGPVPWQTPSTGSKVADVVADIIGTGLGFLTPGGAAGKVMGLAEVAAQAGAARLPARLAPVAAPLLRGATGGAAFGAMEAATEGKPLPEVAKRAAEEAGYWTGAELGLGVALPAAARAAGRALSRVAERKVPLSQRKPAAEVRTQAVSEQPALQRPIVEQTGMETAARIESGLPASIEAMATRPETSTWRPAAGTSIKPVVRKVMIDRLAKALGLPTRVGRFNIPSALGIFKRNEEVIRTKLAEDMPVIAHEAGHGLDKMFRIRETVKDPEMAAELINLGKTQPKRHFTEGIAEFMRYYLTGEDAALKQVAPKFYEWFEATAKQETRIWDALQRFRQDYKDYMTAPAKARVKAAISVGERQGRKVTIDRFMEAAVDDLRPIDSFVQKVTGGGKGRKALAASENPFVQAWLFRGWAGKARNAIWYGVRNKDGEKVAPALMEILRPVAKNIDDFRAYIVSRRAVELHARGKETGLDANDVKQVVAELDSPEFRQAFGQLKQYQDAILDRLVESGIISAEQKAVIRRLNQEYVPFYRVFDPNAGGVSFGKRGFADLSVPIKRLKGSGRTIVDPLESIIKNTYYMTNLAERNNVGRTLVEFANKYEGMGKFVEKVDPKVYPISFNLGEVKKYLEQVGVDLPSDALQEVATVFRPNMTGSLKENILTVFRNGKPELYQLDPDLYRAVLMLDQESTNTLIRLMSYPASWLRAGAVLSPEFAIRNVMRDAFGSWVFSKYGFVPGLDTVRGLFHVIRKDDLYQQWLEGGGASATLVSLDRAYLQEDLRKLLTKDIWQKMKMYARHPLEVLRVLTEFSEEATRVGEFAKGLRAEARQGVPIGEAIQRAALASRDITLDFSRAGTVGRPTNQLIAFFNASVQGIDKMRRAFKKNPAKATLRSFTYITMPSIALWAINHDSPKYQQLPQWRKDLFWNIIAGDYIVSIPKPFELGVIFGSLPERILDWAYRVDQEAVSKWANTFKETVAPNWIPTALVPVIEVMTNYSFFQGRPLTPMGEQYLLKQEQYGSTTTETAKTLSRLLAATQGGEAALSPREIETLVRGYTGGLGMHGMAIASAFMPKEYTPPAKDIAEYPGIKAVLSRPFQGAEGVNDFYNRLEELEKKARTAKRLHDAGKSIPASLQYDKAELSRLRKASDRLAELRKQREKVLKSGLSPEEKRAKIDAINIQSINIAQKALGRPPVQ